MMTRDHLQKKIATLDRKDYGAFQSLIGSYAYERFTFIIEQIPKDPYAPPHTGIYRIQIPLADTVIENGMLDSKVAQIACRDYFARSFFSASQTIAGERRGTGYSGIITVDEPGRTILERSSVVLHNGMLEVRCFVGLPASGRNIKAKLALAMLLEELPEIVFRSLHKEHTDKNALLSHIHTAKDAEFLRGRLAEMGLVAFIADGALLPRKSGTSDHAMSAESVIPFTSPRSLRRVITLPHAGEISGMGIPRGVTLLTGGGYHGKSTLLHAVEMGVYNHVSGDGRERCVTLETAVKVRAYSGRHVVKTDISAFIRNLPFDKDTVAFSTENASGSTSQAASIVESMEMGATVLLMDEDTCAANFMVRDRHMQKLVSKSDEPITSYIDKVRQLYTQKKISTILVLGGVGDYFEVADTVVRMKNYLPVDATERAKRIIRESTSQRLNEDTEYPVSHKARIPLRESVNPAGEHGKRRLYATEVHTLHFGRDRIDLNDLEQLLELSQTKAVGYAMQYAKRYMDGEKTLKQVIDLVMADIDAEGLDILSERISGHFARFRPFELAFALNRMRSFNVAQEQHQHQGVHHAGSP